MECKEKQVHNTSKSSKTLQKYYKTPQNGSERVETCLKYPYLGQKGPKFAQKKNWEKVKECFMTPTAWLIWAIWHWTLGKDLYRCHTKRKISVFLGSYHFLPGRGPCVCDRRSPIFSAPPLSMHKKKLWSPLGLHKKILVPPPPWKNNPLHK